MIRSRKKVSTDVLLRRSAQHEPRARKLWKCKQESGLLGAVLDKSPIKFFEIYLYLLFFVCFRAYRILKCKLSPLSIFLI